MNLDIAVLADAANVSREGKLNICGIFRNIFGPQLPVVWPSMVLAMQVTLNASEKGKAHTLGLLLVDPTNKPVQQFPDVQFEVPGDAPGAFFTLPFVLNLSNMVFPALGVYRFALSLDGTSAGTLPIEVGQPPQQAAPSVPTPPVAEAG